MIRDCDIHQIYRLSEVIEWLNILTVNRVGQRGNKQNMTFSVLLCYVCPSTRLKHLELLHTQIDFVSYICYTYSQCHDRDYYRPFVCGIVLHFLKEYYEIVDEARPLSGFFSPTHADFLLQKCISSHETKHIASFQVIRALIASQSTFEK